MKTKDLRITKSADPLAVDLSSKGRRAIVKYGNVVALAQLVQGFVSEAMP